MDDRVWEVTFQKQISNKQINKQNTQPLAHSLIHSSTHSFTHPFSSPPALSLLLAISSAWALKINYLYINLSPALTTLLALFVFPAPPTTLLLALFSTHLLSLHLTNGALPKRLLSLYLFVDHTSFQVSVFIHLTHFKRKYKIINEANYRILNNNFQSIFNKPSSCCYSNFE